MSGKITAATLKRLGFRRDIGGIGNVWVGPDEEGGEPVRFYHHDLPLDADYFWSMVRREYMAAGRRDARTAMLAGLGVAVPPTVHGEEVKFKREP